MSTSAFVALAVGVWRVMLVRVGAVLSAAMAPKISLLFWSTPSPLVPVLPPALTASLPEKVTLPAVVTVGGLPGSP
ncbi:MAG: hypothetical protein F6K00_04575 [Leptolyngbya sp. SIOISBB]|nr:hypothetical protein [Leptolyngbya sp. SIOISBB]